MPTRRLSDFARLGLALCCLASPALADPEADAIGGSQRPSKDTPTEKKHAEDDPRIDTESGRDLRIWPPDCPFVHKHMKLELVFPDMAHSSFTAVDTLTVAPAVYPQSELDLDAGPAIKLGEISVNDKPVTFEHDGGHHTLKIDLGRPFAPGETAVIRMTYKASRAGVGGSGLTWSKDDPETPEEDFMIHSQGQAQSNHLWFPCHDFPNLRLSTEMVVTVPDPYEAVSNGRLVEVSHKPMSFPDADGHPGQPRQMATFHWLQEKPHVYYLVVLTIGRYDVVNVGGPKSARPGLWMPVYGPLGSADRLRTLFANTPEMIALYEETFGVPFPWDKYAQIICRDFSAGAMENTSATTFMSFAARGRRRASIDDFISHELLHQWFGDLVTCASWEHIWLNEGWATMGEALWAQKRRGERGYQSAMMRNVTIERSTSSRRRAPEDQGMISNLYSDPDERFTGPDNVYHKGGMILHMLRNRLGDELFFKAAREYLQGNAFKQAETDDFRLVLERVSGQSLERFFAQWAYRPGHPDLGIDYVWDAASVGDGGKLTIKIEQTQTIDGLNPAYAFDLPFVLKFDDEKKTEQEVHVAMDTRTASLTVDLPAKPSEVQVDPALTILSRNKIRQKLADSVRQLRDDEPFYVRYQAAAALAASTDPEADAALRTLIDGVDPEPETDALLLKNLAEDALERHHATAAR